MICKWDGGLTLSKSGIPHEFSNVYYVRITKLCIILGDGDIHFSKLEFLVKISLTLNYVPT